MQPRNSAGRRFAGTPFVSVEEAWFWTINALRARHEGVRGAGVPLARPCDPDDVVLCLDGLYRDRRIDLGHVRVLRSWGERQARPDPFRAASEERRLWEEAMALLAPALRRKGIVA